MGTSAAHAMDMSGMIGELGAGARAPSISYSGWLEPRSDSGNAFQNRATASVPVYRDEKNTYTVSASASDLHFDRQQEFSNQSYSVPQDLQRYDVGVSYSRKLAAAKMWGAKLSVGSASDHPFANFNTTTFLALGYYSIPGQSEASRWIFTIFMSNNNEIANYIPIPGFVYTYTTATFTGLFGLPFAAVQWRPSSMWTWSGSLLGPEINLESAYGRIRQTQGFVGYSWSQQSFLPKDRPDQRDRLYFNEMRAFAGIRSFFSRDFSFEFETGYAFDRSLYEGLRTFSRDVGSTSLSNAPFAQITLKMDL